MSRPLVSQLWSCLEASPARPPAVQAGLVCGFLESVLDAGALQLERLGHVGRVRSKSAARDLVTETDVACERMLVARLRELAPDHAIEAEEEVHDAARDAAGSGLRWFIDPLDGTVNFVHGLASFGISAALYDGPTPLFGVVHAPRLGETFIAARGAGAWLAAGGLPPQRLAVSSTDTLGEAVLGTGFPYRRGELAHSNLENFGRFFYDVRDLRRMGSAALDLACVAAGRLDGFWELHLAPHDVAAGALLVREAGGLVSDADGGDAWLRDGHIVAAGPGLAAAIRERIRH
ncbi:MAG: inositol monophosphatase family protein [Planctomycetota bacterium]